MCCRLGMALDKKYTSAKKSKKRRKKGLYFCCWFSSCGLRRRNATQLAKHSRVLHVKPSNKGYLFLSVILLSGRKGSRADEEEPDLGISYEVLPAGAGELPEVRFLFSNVCQFIILNQLNYTLTKSHFCNGLIFEFFEFFGFAAMVSPLFSLCPTLPYVSFLSLTYSMSVSKMRAFDPVRGILGCGGIFYPMHQEPIFYLS